MVKTLVKILLECFIVLACFALVVITLTAGGVVVHVGPLKVSLRHIKNPLILLGITLAIRRIVGRNFFSDMYCVHLLKKSIKWVRTIRGLKCVKAAAQKGALLCFSIVFFVLLLFPLLEVILQTGIFDNNGVIWFPERYKTINYNINRENQQFADKHPYHFTDTIHAVQKTDGVFRIAVLGDSFVWGDGLPYEQAWSHKLKQKITQAYKHIEVMSWGWRGWSTLDEFQFLQKDGVKYDINVLIVGFVLNDPDMKTYEKKNLVWQDSRAWYGRILLTPIRTYFPNAFHFLISHVNSLLTNYVLKDYGYKAWHNKLYSPENLQRYSELLSQFAAYCDEHHIRLLFVLTPSTHEVYRQQRFETIMPLLDHVPIEYLNLFPAVARKFHDYSPRELWANPANPHPGPMVTELYAAEVLAYLRQHNILLASE